MKGRARVKNLAQRAQWKRCIFVCIHIIPWTSPGNCWTNQGPDPWTRSWLESRGTRGIG